MGKNLPNFTPTYTRTPTTVTLPMPTATTSKTTRQAVARQTQRTPMPGGTVIRLLQGMGVRTVSTPNAIFGSFAKVQVLGNQGMCECMCVRACVCVCRVGLHGW